jgi:hypothetical protein
MLGHPEAQKDDSVFDAFTERVIRMLEEAKENLRVMEK